MFGHRFYGERYFAPRFFGPAAGAVVEESAEVFDVASIGRIRISQDETQARLAEQKAAEQELLRSQVMAAVEAEKMAAAMRAESEISAPEPQYSAVQMLPVKFRGRK